nr:hypothetical protein [Paracoccus marinaquae]
MPAALAHRDLWIRSRSLAVAFCAAGRRLGADRAAVARLDPYASPWARLFQQEPAYLFAQLISFDPAEAGFAFSEVLERDPHLAAAMIADLAGQLQGFIQRMDFDAPRLFSRQLDQMDAEIRLRERLGVLAVDRKGAVLDLLRQHPAVEALKGQGRALAAARELHEQLRAAHTMLRNAAATFAPLAQAAFDNRIHSGRIDPALGLLIAELRTAQHVEAALNRLPEIHTRHYYDAIIGQKPAPPGTERVLLALDQSLQSLHLAPETKLAARLPDATIQQFSSEAAVPVGPAMIADVAMLAYETDRHISYNAALDGITGVRAARFRPDAATGDPSGRVFTQGSEIPNQMGLDISSPMLALSEGVRLIEVSLHLKRCSDLPAASRPLTRHEQENPGPFPDPDVRLVLAGDPDLVAAMMTGKREAAVETLTLAISQLALDRQITPSMSLIYEHLTGLVPGVAGLRMLLGRIATLSLIERAPFPAGEYWTRLFALIDRHRPDLVGQGRAGLEPYEDALQGSMIFSAFSERPDGTIDYTPEDVFESLLGDAFDLRLSTAEGPVSPSMMQVLPIRARRSSGGITLSLRLDPSVPAITGPAPGFSPTLMLRAAGNGRLCPLSFFERYTLENVEFTVKVSGLRKLSAFSDEGPVTTAQTFAPFGQRPADGSTFQVGHPEMAGKPVTAVGVVLTWDAIPDRIGGFVRHYDGYPKWTDIPDPVLQVDYLSGDGWKPVSAAPLPLFQSEDVAGELMETWRFEGQVAGHSIPATGAVSPDEFRSRQTVRAGMVRLTLAGTAGGFGRDQYPLALVRAMRPQLLPFLARRVPSAPFVPSIARFSLDYTAHAVTDVNAPDSARPGERIVQVGPFGRVEVFPQRMMRDFELFPPRLGFGQLFIQITGPNPTGPTVICFDIAESAHLRLVPRPNPVRWCYLSAHGWKDMPETSLSSDTTAGLMRSGLVTIDLPEDAIEHSPEMPAGGVWIAAVATTRRLHVFPRLNRISVNGIWVRRGDSSWRGDEPGRVWSFNPPQPGIGAIREIATPGDVHPPETTDAYVARVGERLRHRRRAVTPWDIERMVLQEFPEVWMVKCLPHLDRTDPAPMPGVATVVAVRRPPGGRTPRHPEPCLFDVAVLQRIHDFIAGQGTAFARFEVVNPAFERLQVRAKIAVEAGRENGAMAQALKHELARYLSVWTAGRALQRFGWSLNTRALKAHIADLGYVRGVTDFSVLHLSADDSRSHELLDTAQAAEDPRGLYGPIIRPRRPWGLPLSAADHVLTILSDIEEEAPAASGIGSLHVGEMLIVGQRTTP